MFTFIAYCQTELHASAGNFAKIRFSRVGATPKDTEKPIDARLKSERINDERLY
ncbi:hypothetical protein [Desulfosporosinus hippei]|uniref:hypothetical protein n=1 Tax=Desulfosporosinus hippei TaxID=569859 RepID=UPI001FA73C75|nr:hypothetical protein [Desulfosporosinus hippei]